MQNINSVILYSSLHVNQREATSGKNLTYNLNCVCGILYIYYIILYLCFFKSSRYGLYTNNTNNNNQYKDYPLCVSLSGPCINDITYYNTSYF